MIQVKESMKNMQTCYRRLDDGFSTSFLSAQFQHASEECETVIYTSRMGLKSVQSFVCVCVCVCVR